MSTRLLAVSTAVFATIAVVQTEQIVRSQTQTKEALVVMGNWEKLAKEWEENYEALASVTRARINQFQDDVLVCNSMLPEGRKFR